MNRCCNFLSFGDNDVCVVWHVLVMFCNVAVSNFCFFGGVAGVFLHISHQNIGGSVLVLCLNRPTTV